MVGVLGHGVGQDKRKVLDRSVTLNSTIPNEDLYKGIAFSKEANSAWYIPSSNQCAMLQIQKVK